MTNEGFFKLISWNDQPVCRKCKRNIRKNDVRYVAVCSCTGRVIEESMLCIPCLIKMNDFMDELCTYPENKYGEHPTAWYPEENVKDDGKEDFNKEWHNDYMSMDGDK